MNAHATSNRWLAWVDRLAQALAEVSQTRMVGSSPDIAYGRHRGPPRHDARRSAVLVAWHDHPAGPRFALTRRSEKLKSHGGQISLPGGKVEPGETFEAAALREFVEELRPRDSASVPRILGQLPEIYVFVSNFRMAPVVSAVDGIGEYDPNPDEVGDVHWVTLAALRDDSRWSRSHTVQRGKLTFDAPAFRLEDDTPVWGATCLVLRSLRAACEIVGQHGDAP